MKRLVPVAAAVAALVVCAPGAARAQGEAAPEPGPSEPAPASAPEPNSGEPSPPSAPGAGGSESSKPSAPGEPAAPAAPEYGASEPAAPSAPERGPSAGAAEGQPSGSAGSGAHADPVPGDEAAAPHAEAPPGGDSAAGVEEADEVPGVPWRGTAVIYEHAASAIAIHRGADRTWNPYYAHALTLRPEWHFDDHLVARASWSLVQELTDADDTTRRREVRAGDLTLAFGAEALPLPWLELELTPDVELGVPISKESRAASLLLAIGPGLALGRSFDVLAGLDLAWGVRWTHAFHEWTTVQLAQPTVRCARPGRGACGEFLHTGDRNARDVIVTGPSASLAVTEQLSLDAAFELRRATLYALGDTEVGSALGPVRTGDAADDVSARHDAAFDLSASYDVLPALTATLGAATEYGQLDESGEWRTPFFNRFTDLYVDFTLKIDALVQSARGE